MGMLLSKGSTNPISWVIFKTRILSWSYERWEMMVEVNLEKKKRYTYLNVSHCFSQFIKSLLRQSQKSRIDNELIPRSRKMANNSSENPGGNIISFAWSKLQFIMDMTNGFSVQCTKVPPRCAHSSSSIWLVFQKPVLYFIFSVAEFFSLSSFKI